MYEVAPGWVLVVHMAPSRDYFSIMAVDYRDPAAAPRRAAWAEMGRGPGIGVVTHEGTCVGLDQGTCVGTPAHLLIRQKAANALRASRAERGGLRRLFASISSFFVPTVSADASASCRTTFTDCSCVPISRCLEEPCNGYITLPEGVYDYGRTEVCYGYSCEHAGYACCCPVDDCGLWGWFGYTCCCANPLQE